MHILGLTKKDYFNGRWKKKFAAKRRDFSIRGTVLVIIKSATTVALHCTHSVEIRCAIYHAPSYYK